MTFAVSLVARFAFDLKHAFHPFIPPSGALNIAARSADPADPARTIIALRHGTVQYHKVQYSTVQWPIVRYSPAVMPPLLGPLAVSLWSRELSCCAVAQPKGGTK